MIHVKPPENEKSLRFKLRGLSVVTKQYLLFLAIALITSALESLFFVFHENMICGFSQMIIVFNVIYLLIVIIIIGMSSRYNREKSMIVAIIPAFISTLGYLVSFWLYVEFFDEDLSYGDIFLALLAVFFIPVITSFLDKSLGVKAWKLYASSLGQIFFSGLVLWLEIYLFL